MSLPPKIATHAARFWRQGTWAHFLNVLIVYGQPRRNLDPPPAEASLPGHLGRHLDSLRRVWKQLGPRTLGSVDLASANEGRSDSACARVGSRPAQLPAGGSPIQGHHLLSDARSSPLGDLRGDLHRLQWHLQHHGWVYGAAQLPRDGQGLRTFHRLGRDSGADSPAGVRWLHGWPAVWARKTRRSPDEVDRLPAGIRIRWRAHPPAVVAWRLAVRPVDAL